MTWTSRSIDEFGRADSSPCTSVALAGAAWAFSGQMPMEASPASVATSVVP
jgi:hypothetical protein